MAQITQNTQHKQTPEGPDLNLYQEPAPHAPPLLSPISASVNGPSQVLPLMHPIFDSSAVDPNRHRLSENNQRDELSELFEDIERLVTSPDNLAEGSLSQQPALPLDAIYNPSLVTPGAPSLPSARHRIAKRPYHLSTDHHSAIISLSKPGSHDVNLDDIQLEDIVPRKRPITSHDDEEPQCKRSRQPSYYTNDLQMPPLGFSMPLFPSASTIPQKRPSAHVPHELEETDYKRSCTPSNYTSSRQSPKNCSPKSLQPCLILNSTNTSSQPQGSLMQQVPGIEQDHSNSQTLTTTNHTIYSYDLDKQAPDHTQSAHPYSPHTTDGDPPTEVDSHLLNPPHAVDQSLTQSQKKPSSSSRNPTSNEDFAHARKSPKTLLLHPQEYAGRNNESGPLSQEYIRISPSAGHDPSQRPNSSENHSSRGSSPQDSHQKYARNTPSLNTPSLNTPILPRANQQEIGPSYWHEEDSIGQLSPINSHSSNPPSAFLELNGRGEPAYDVAQNQPGLSISNQTYDSPQINSEADCTYQQPQDTLTDHAQLPGSPHAYRTSSYSSYTPNPTSTGGQINSRNQTRACSAPHNFASNPAPEYAQFKDSSGRELTNQVYTNAHIFASTQTRPRSAPQDVRFESASEYAHNQAIALFAQSKESPRSKSPSKTYTGAQVLNRTQARPRSSSKDVPSRPAPVDHSIILNPSYTQPQQATRQISNHQDCAGTSLKPPLWDQFQFDLGEDHIMKFVSSSATPDPPQFFDPRPRDGPSHIQSAIFQQSQTQENALRSLPDTRPSSRMSMCSAKNQNTHPNQQHTLSQSSRSSRLSYSSTNEQHLNRQHAHAATSTTRPSSRMSISSAKNHQTQQNQQQTPSQSSRSSINEQQFNPQLAHTATSSTRPSSRMSVCSAQNQQNQQRDSFQNSQSISYSSTNQQQLNPQPVQAATSTYQHPPLAFSSRSSRVNTNYSHRSVPPVLMDNLAPQHSSMVPDPSRTYDQELAKHNDHSSGMNQGHLQSSYHTVPNNSSPGHLRPHSSQPNTIPVFNSLYKPVSHPHAYQTHHQPDVVPNLTNHSHISNPRHEDHTRAYISQSTNPPYGHAQFPISNSGFVNAPTAVSQMHGLSSTQLPSRDQFRFDFAGNPIPTFGVPFQVQDSLTSHGQPQTSRDLFRQPSSRPSSRMSICSEQQKSPQRGHSSRISYAADDREPAPQPSAQFTPQPVPQPVPRHVPQPVPQSIPRPPPQLSPRFAPQSVPRPVAQPVAQSIPRPAPRPPPRPAPQPPPQPAAHPQHSTQRPVAQPIPRPAPRPPPRPAAHPQQSTQPTPHQYLPSGSVVAISEVVPRRSQSMEDDENNNDETEDRPPEESQENQQNNNQHNNGQSEDVQCEDDNAKDDQDTEESDFDGVFDLAESRKYKNHKSARQAKKTIARHEGAFLEKLSKTPIECDQYERLAIAIHHFNNLLLGIVRKRKGQKGNRSLPSPPLDEEYSLWDQRKVECRRIIDKSVEEARTRYRRKHPQAQPAQLAKVGEHAAEEAISGIVPVRFTSLVALRNSGVHYSTTVASTCEATLALSGFPRFTYDWTDTFKSKWNEAVSVIILQEWEKCYRRGDADDYDVDVNQVNAKNTRQVLERWFHTKCREYAKQLLQKEQQGTQPGEQEASKERSRGRQSQKRVCQLRRDALKKFFPENRALRNILSEQSVHSEDEVDANGNSYRKQKLWRHRNLDTFLHQLDELHIGTQRTEQASTSAAKALRRGPYAAPADSEYLARPPKGFPKSLLDEGFMRYHVSRVAVLGLELSTQEYDLAPLVAHAQWLQLTDAS